MAESSSLSFAFSLFVLSFVFVFLLYLPFSWVCLCLVFAFVFFFGSPFPFRDLLLPVFDGAVGGGGEDNGSPLGVEGFEGLDGGGVAHTPLHTLKRRIDVPHTYGVVVRSTVEAIVGYGQGVHRPRVPRQSANQLKSPQVPQQNRIFVGGGIQYIPTHRQTVDAATGVGHVLHRL